MADERIRSLTSVITALQSGDFFVVDGIARSSAARISSGNVALALLGLYARIDSVAVVSGANTITFSSPLSAATFVVLTQCYDATNGENISGSVTGRTAAGFTYNSAGDGTLEYIALMRI